LSEAIISSKNIEMPIPALPPNADISSLKFVLPEPILKPD